MVRLRFRRRELFAGGLGLLNVWKLASSLNVGDSCIPNPNVQAHEKGPCQNYALVCDPVSNICKPKGCRVNESLLEWPLEWQIPVACNMEFEFCPDDQLKCLPKIKTGDVCSPGRDDSCLERESICLNQRCISKNVQPNQPCRLDNTTIYGVNRDDCSRGSFCPEANLICLASFTNGEKCIEDRQCLSNNCHERNRICTDGEVYNYIPIWAYVLAGLGVLALIFVVILILYFRKRRRMSEFNRALQERNFSQAEAKLGALEETNGFVTIIPEPSSQNNV
ncbi:hypothetical protein K493DRAFT_283268 [Basidiobolus meristosporus CBS 931.73]|uniref:Uncharacterized protein n=1 Tax=Basidiobolus meristosporus CBS 931.73 TaxID=1314790 RepID=A0A1Y1YAI3_9FUNG|nr:hypothetical protein K493DRAFT_283268 [Basidiobolus meristosporus CBS 931.73]|eukprot:ORX94988.1 hypothetical protein K493DRAFT_283268 [Basidiobolus meristosporus CBS 931.73]